MIEILGYYEKYVKNALKSPVYVGVKHMLQSKKVAFLHIYPPYWAKWQYQLTICSSQEIWVTATCC